MTKKQSCEKGTSKKKRSLEGKRHQQKEKLLKKTHESERRTLEHPLGSNKLRAGGSVEVPPKKKSKMGKKKGFLSQ